LRRAVSITAKAPQVAFSSLEHCLDCFDECTGSIKRVGIRFNRCEAVEEALSVWWQLIEYAVDFSFTLSASWKRLSNQLKASKAFVSVAISSMMEVKAGSAPIEASREEAAWSTAEDYAILDVEFTCCLLACFAYLLWCKTCNSN
jgi:hypothetical protein